MSHRSPVPPKRESLRESLSRAILSRGRKLERKNSDRDLNEDEEDEDSVVVRDSPVRPRRQGLRSARSSFASSSLTRPTLDDEGDDDEFDDDETINTRNTFSDSADLSLGDVEYALESPTSQTERGIMRKRTTLDSVGMASAARMASDFERSRDLNQSRESIRFQNSSDGMFIKAPPLVESDDSMLKSHHVPTSKKSRQKSISSIPEKNQEIFLLRLSICFLLTGCLLLTAKHFRLMRHIKNDISMKSQDISPYTPPAGVGNVLKPNPKARIIGGNTAADPQQYPWFVLFHGSSICGGAMIAPDVVLTAAHCEGAGAPGNGENFVYLNALSRSAEGLSNADKIDVLQERPHTLYFDGLYAHDLMLVKLDRDVKKDPLPYIKMNLDGLSSPKPDDELEVLGYGDIDKNADSIVIPDQLQHVTVEAVEFTYCWTLYEAGALALRERGMVAQDLTQDQMCAEAKGAGTCAGDSGGPLIVPKGNGIEEDVLVGAVAWHRGGCGNDLFPDVYSNITWFADWIVTNACEMSDDASHLPCSS